MEGTCPFIMIYRTCMSMLLKDRTCMSMLLKDRHQRLGEGLTKNTIAHKPLT